MFNLVYQTLSIFFDVVETIVGHSIPVGSIYHARTFTFRQNHHNFQYDSKWYHVDPSNDSAIQRFPYLEIPTKYEYFIGNASWYQVARFFDAIIDVDYRCHAFTYIMSIVLYWRRPCTKFFFQQEIYKTTNTSECQKKEWLHPHSWTNWRPTTAREEPVVRYKWTGRVWEIIGWSSRL